MSACRFCIAQPWFDASETSYRPPLRLDPIKRELIDGNRHLPVTKREYLVLECLMRQFDIPVRHDELLRYAWPEKEDIDFSTASPLVWRLRRKLRQHFPDVNIATVSCYGYQLTRTRQHQT